MAAETVRPESDKVLRQRRTGGAQGAGPAATHPAPACRPGPTARPPLLPTAGAGHLPQARPTQPARSPRARPPKTLPRRDPKEAPGLREPSAVPQSQQPLFNGPGRERSQHAPLQIRLSCGAFWDLGGSFLQLSLPLWSSSAPPIFQSQFPLQIC